MILLSKFARMLGFTTTLLFCLSCSSAAQEIETPTRNFITFYINESVTNAEEDYAEQIIENWKTYLLSGNYFLTNSPYWNYDEMKRPDYSYVRLLLGLRHLQRNNAYTQCNIIAIIPVEEGHYLLKCMFTQMDEDTQQVILKYITSVYAKRVDGRFQFVNSTQYHKGNWEKRIIGDVTYYIHPEHRFDEQQAQEMNEFNQKMAQKFEIAPIQFDYFVTNNTTQTNQLLGYDFNRYSYMPIRSGGLADNYNTIIYAGNNAAYYPHEVVHLYTYKKFTGQYHTWVDEGIAAYFGGSTGYYLDWHLQKLKTFLAENPDFPLDDLTALQQDIPNGEYTTDFRYAIGGFLMKQIYEKEGMQGFFDALQAGKEEEDYFRMLKEKLGVTKNEFADYIKAEMLKLKVLNQQEMMQLKY